MFDRLAKGIVKHHKKVVIVWLVLLVLAIYPIQFVRDVIVYEETGFAPPDVESQRAQNIIDEQFPTSLANSSVIVVLEASDIASEDVRDFALEVEQNVVGDPEIVYLDNFTSVYTVYQLAFLEVAKALAGQLHVTETGINQTGFLFFSGPSFFAPIWDDSPVDNATYDVTWISYSAYVNATRPDLVPLISLLQGYSMLFRTDWDRSFDIGNTDVYSPPGTPYSERANHVLEHTTPTFFVFDPIMPSGNETQLLYFTTFSGLDVSTWNNSMIIHLVMLQAMQGHSGASLAFLENLYQLGPTPSLQDLNQFALAEVERDTINSYWLELPSGTEEFLVNTTTNTMLFSIDFSITPGFTDDDGNNIMEKNLKLIRNAIDDAKDALGVQYIDTYTTGDVALGADIERAAFEDVERIDPITIALVFIIIGVFFMSFVTPGAAVGGIGIAVVISQSIIIIIGMFVAKVHFSVLTLMLTAMLGAGTDYAIFLMARYREERLRGNSKEKSVEECVRWAGESITTSGLAVMISFGALGLGSFDLVKTMGLTIMLGIGVALLVALTFIPSLLMLVGDRVFWPGYKKWEERRKKGDGAYTRYFRKSARISVKHAKKITLMALVLTIPAVYGVFTIETSFDFLAAMPETEATRGIAAMGEGFGEGRLSPTLVVIEAPSSIRSSSNGNVTYDISFMGSVEAISSELSEVENVQQVNGPTRPQGVPIDYTDLNNATLQEEYAQYIEPTIGEDNQTILLSIILKKEAFTPESVETIATVRSIIDDQQNLDANLGNSEILVGGATAAIKDIKDVLDRDFQLMAVVVIIADFILLMFVLGSILVPLRLILTILLSISWTLAATFLVFQIWLQIPILWLMPWILFVIAMGLGMDYDIFLTTRIREEVAKGKSDKDAIVTAVEKTGGIITAAGLVMAGAFSTMMLSSLGLLQEFGFALAFVILLDAMIVRIYLVPSVMILLEKWNWWAPGRLQRVRREEKKRRRKG